MRGGSSRAVVRHLRTLYQFGVVGSLSDEQLLERYLARRDTTAEEAFAELVQRHGPMVLGVCRRILGDDHAAEDAFQATFLVLARKAATAVRGRKVAGWLYIAALRTAREARVRAARRWAREQRMKTRIYVEPPDEAAALELRAILDDELAHLPARHREPVVLCELEGLSRSEAARRLNIPEGTLSSRLARAKVQLRDRLVARGISLSSVAISTILIREARAVTVPLSLLESTVQAATLVATGPCSAAAISASVTSLCEGVIKTMLIAKLKGIALTIGVMTVIVSGAVVLAQSGADNTGTRGGSEPAKAEPAIVALDPGQAPGAHWSVYQSAQVDRTAALERKLDLILQALKQRDPGDPAHTWTTQAPAADSKPFAKSEGPIFHGELVNPDPLDPRTVFDRLQAIEQQVQAVQNRLDRVEVQVKSLEARVGGRNRGRVFEPAKK
jgi:RNA polymerase sigma factor (sigma-70 family)